MVKFIFEGVAGFGKTTLIDTLANRHPQRFVKHRQEIVNETAKLFNLPHETMMSEIAENSPMVLIAMAFVKGMMTFNDNDTKHHVISVEDRSILSQLLYPLTHKFASLEAIMGVLETDNTRQIVSRAAEMTLGQQHHIFLMVYSEDDVVNGNMKKSIVGRGNMDANFSDLHFVTSNKIFLWLYRYLRTTGGKVGKRTHLLTLSFRDPEGSKRCTECFDEKAERRYVVGDPPAVDEAAAAISSHSSLACSRAVEEMMRLAGLAV